MAAISFTPGQVVPAADWQALFDQHGGPKSQQIRPLTKAERTAIEDAGDDPEQNPVYRYHAADGSYVEARTSPSGDYQIVDYHPSTTFTQAQTAETKAADEWHTEGRPNGQGWFDNTRPIMARTVNGTKQTREPTAKELEDWNLAGQMTRNPGGQTDAQIEAAAAKKRTEDEKNRPQLVPGTLGADFEEYATLDPTTGELTWHPNDHRNPPAAPASQQFIPVRRGGQIVNEKNPNYIKPSRVQWDEKSGQFINITVDDNGNAVVMPVDNKTAIKPADLPVLQTRYGQVAQDLGRLAAELNGRLARGEITEQQRNEAFAAAHKQADTQVSEINSILENSRATWTNELSARRDTFNEASNRRTYAGNILDRAVSTGATIAASSGPGHGAAIAGGVGALLGIGQRYAEGMGGLPDMTAPTTPRALQQARDVDLPGGSPPGFGATGGGLPAAPGVPGGLVPGGAPEVATSAAGSGAGSAPSSPSPIFRPPPPVPGQSPVAPLDQLGQSMGAGVTGSPIGMPVASGGGGYFDADAEAQNMIGDGSDPAWAQAVQQALAEQRGSRYRTAAIAGRSR